MSNNFVLYRASAGSGKTYTLVKEFLSICLSSDNVQNFKDILAVTFTNKAANEMKYKILKNLDEIITKSREESSMKNDLLINRIAPNETVLLERAKRLYDEILHNYSDFSVSTIDSFVQQISRSFAKELNLPNQYRVLIDDDDFLDEIMKRIDAKIENNNFLNKILTQFIRYRLEGDGSWRIESLIVDFIKKLLKENAYKKTDPSELKHIDEAKYEEIENYLSEKIQSLHQIITDNIDRYEAIPDKSSHLKVVTSLIDKLKKDIYTDTSKLLNDTVKGILSGDKKWYKGKQEPDSDINIVKLLNEIIDSHKLLTVTKKIEKNMYLYVLRETFTDVMNEYIDETNKVHISEFNKRISDIIDDYSTPFIYERLGSRYKHFFIDEFQDTSLLQWFNFMPLVYNSLSENRKNILVGDAKQAIYRFRNGEVEQIIKLPHIYKSPENLDSELPSKFKDEFFEDYLKTNYRTKKNIVEFNNSFFAKAKEYIHEDYKIVYDKLEQNVKQGDTYDGYVGVRIFKTDEFRNKDTQRVDNTLYKSAVKDYILNDIRNLSEKGFSFSDIVILVRNNSDGSDIAEYLSSNKIPVISSDSILLKSSDKVQLIISSLKYLMNPNDDVCKLTLAYYRALCKTDVKDIFELEALWNEFDSIKYEDLDNTGFSLYDLCLNIINMYGLSLAHDVFLQYFMSLVYDWQNTENAGINAFIDYWYRKSDSLFVKLSANIDAVQIMTVHKSKGLEFKVVMYPYAYTKLPEKLHTNDNWIFKSEIDSNVIIGDDLKKIIKNIPYIDAFVMPVNSSLAETDLQTYYDDELKKAAFDDLNVMYVAMTRPKDVLYIYTRDYKSKDGYNIFTDYFGIGEDSEDSDNYFYEIGEIEYEEEKSDNDNIEELTGTDEKKSMIKWTDVLDVDKDISYDFDSNHSDAQEWGNLVHEIFSKIYAADDAEKVLKMYVRNCYIDEETSDMLLACFKDIVSNEYVGRAYSKDAVVKNEMSIMTERGEILRPDRFSELPEKIILIDYKTGSESKKHYEQLKSYINEIKNMGVEKNIEAFLIYIDEDVTVKKV